MSGVFRNIADATGAERDNLTEIDMTKCHKRDQHGLSMDGATVSNVGQIGTEYTDIANYLVCKTR